MKLVRSAGGIVWKGTPAEPRIAVVHRARHGDWSLPKGKVDRGETWQDAARREIAEETGCEVRLGRFAGAKLYLHRRRPKLVLYWLARVVREDPLGSDEEIDEVAWLSRREALDRLDHASDRRLVLRAFRGSPGNGCRAYDAPGASGWSGADELRSLVIVDSRKAQRALPSVLGEISQAVSSGAGRFEARRA